MDEQKSAFYKNLSFWNLIFFIALTITGLLVTKCLQDRVEKLEIENRAQTFRPKIELKEKPKVSRIIFTRDTNWIHPQNDIDKIHPENNPSTKVIMNLQANFSFTLINNSEHIADLSAAVFFGKKNEKSEKIENLTDRKKIREDIVTEKIIQLDERDTFTVDYNNHIIDYLNDNDSIFYLHLVVFYNNQFKDLYESYFIIEGQIDESPELIISSNPNIIFLKVDRIVMKDNFIQLKPYSKFTYYLSEEQKDILVEAYEESFEKYDLKKGLLDRILNQEK
jgi:hypothetical protein